MFPFCKMYAQPRALETITSKTYNRAYALTAHICSPLHISLHFGLHVIGWHNPCIYYGQETGHNDKRASKGLRYGFRRRIG